MCCPTFTREVCTVTCRQVLVKKVNRQQAQPSKGRPETEECRYCRRPFKKKTVRFHSAKARRGRRVALGDKLVFTKDKASPERAGGSHLSKPKCLPRDFSPPSAFGSAAPDRRAPEAGMGFRSLLPPPHPFLLISAPVPGRPPPLQPPRTCKVGLGVVLRPSLTPPLALSAAAGERLSLLQPTLGRRPASTDPPLLDPAVHGRISG